MGVYNATVVTTAGQNLIASAIAGGESVSFTALKTSTHVYPAGTALQNLTALSDVKQSVAPTSVDVYNNNVVQISARVPNTGIATAYLINTIGLFGSADGAETLIAVLTAQTPDEVPVFDAESPAAFIFNVQMTIQNADTVVFEVNDSGTATVADVNRIAQPFIGATASVAGHVGRVPAPAAGDDGKFLRGDATWTAPADMVEAFTSSDVADGSATAWTGVNPLTSGETNKSIFAKLSQMFKNIRYLYKMLGTTNISALGNGTVTNALSVINNYGIKTITRSGTTFTVTRNDDTTFTFNQQDNNTWNANSASVAGYVAAGTGHANKVWKTDANGAPAWRDDANTTYGLASTSANGLLRQLDNNVAHFMCGQGTWKAPITSTEIGHVSGKGSSNKVKFNPMDYKLIVIHGWIFDIGVSFAGYGPFIAAAAQRKFTATGGYNTSAYPGPWMLFYIDTTGAYISEVRSNGNDVADNQTGFYVYGINWIN